MSDRIMSVEEALAWLDPSTGPKPQVPSPLLVDRYAHTVIEQDETIQTLSRLLADAEEAATEKAEQIKRVRDVLTDLRGQQEAALQRWDDTGDTWDGATSDTLHDTIHRLTEALAGDTE